MVINLTSQVTLDKVDCVDVVQFILKIMRK